MNMSCHVTTAIENLLQTRYLNTAIKFCGNFLLTVFSSNGPDDLCTMLVGKHGIEVRSD